MVASWPSDSLIGGVSRPPGKSIADVLMGEARSSPAEVGTLGVHHGELVLLLSKQDLLQLAEPYKNP